VSEPTTDVDRAVAAIGGISLNYYSFGGLKITPREPSLSQLFTYNDQGEAEYHPPAPPAEPEATMAPEAPLASHAMPAPSPEADWVEAQVAPQAPLPSRFMNPPQTVSEAEPRPAAPSSPRDLPRAAPLGLPELWRDRRDPLSSTSAIGAEQRSLAAMFNMLAGRAVPQDGDSAADRAAELQSPRADGTRDLFRRL